jgi:hypothetical protein
MLTRKIITGYCKNYVKKVTKMWGKFRTFSVTFGVQSAKY